MLAGEKVVNCPNLKTLSCRHNYRITEIDISECPSLEGLYCSNNQIKELDLSKNLNLKHLVCDNNPIRDLDIKHLSNLESLYCFKCKLNELDVSGLKNLKDLYCANQEYSFYFFKEMGFWGETKLQKIFVNNCIGLKELDCAENSLRELDISGLEKLEFVSCKLCDLENINANNRVSLSYLDCSQNVNGGDKCCVGKINLDNCFKLKNLFITEKSNYDLTKLPALRLLMIDNEEVDIKKEIEKQKKFNSSQNSTPPKEHDTSPKPKPKKFKFRSRKNQVNPEPQPSNNQNSQQSFNQTVKKNTPQPHQLTNYTPYLIGGGVFILGLLVVFSLIKFTKRKKS